jgi:hypothetical protein
LLCNLSLINPCLRLHSRKAKRYGEAKHTALQPSFE